MGSNEIQERMSADIKMKQIKKRRSTNIFKVALFMMRSGKSSRKTAVPADVASKSLWRKLFGSTTTTLRLENGNKDGHSIPTAKAAAIVPEDDDDKKQLPPIAASLAVVNVKPAVVAPDVKVVEKAIVPHLENSQSSPSYASSSCGSEASRYASAMNLRDLDACDEEDEKKNDNAADDDDDDDCEFDDSAGDSMIDVKAEMFIAQFYEQMRLQNT